MQEQLNWEQVNPQAAYWRNRYRLPGTQWTLSGHSRALERSGFFLEEPRIFLDAGVGFHNPSNGNSNAILITHTHIDHMNALPMLLRVGSSDPAVLVPRAHVNGLREFSRLSWGIKGKDGTGRAGVRVDQELKPVPAVGVVVDAEAVRLCECVLCQCVPMSSSRPTTSHNPPFVRPRAGWHTRRLRRRPRRPPVGARVAGPSRPPARLSARRVRVRALLPHAGGHRLRALRDQADDAW
jgi:hypothetical protein